VNTETTSSLAVPAPDWRPCALHATLRVRARLLETLRGYFRDTGALEVETPILASARLWEPHIRHLRVVDEVAPQGWLLSSPEAHMKRLLASGAGDCWQLARVFRAGEQGRWHNPEFTLLEWYRLDFDLAAIMTDAERLLERADEVLGRPHRCERRSYGSLFHAALGVDPHTATAAELSALARACGSPPDAMSAGEAEVSVWLDWLFALVVAPSLPTDRYTLVWGFPRQQAGFARLIEAESAVVAARFEVMRGALELANGYWELTDPHEQKQRLLPRARVQSGIEPAQPYEVKRHEALHCESEIDQRFMAALQSGLPDCSGVALGVDRLLADLLGLETLAEGMAFPADRA